MQRYDSLVSFIIERLIIIPSCFSTRIEFSTDASFLMSLNISSVAIQVFSLTLYLINNLVSINLLGTHFNYKDAAYLIAITVCTFPAFVIGSMSGILRQKGVFHKTDRIDKK